MYQIFEYIHDYICILNKEKKILFCNKSFLNHLKYKNLVGRSLGEIVLPNQKWLTHQATALNKDFLTLKAESGEEMVFCVDQISSTIEQQDVYVLIFHTYSDLFYTKQDLENLLDRLPFHVWIKNNHSEYTYVNQSYANWVSPNQPKEKLFGQSESLYWNDDLVRYFNRTDTQVLEDNKALIIPEVLTINEDEVHWQTHKIPIISNTGEVDSILGVTTIPSNRNQLEVSLAHANRQLHMLYDITKSPVTELNTQSILQHLSTLIAQYLHASALSICEYDALNNQFISCGVYGEFTDIFSLESKIQLDAETLNLIMASNDYVCTLDIAQLSLSIPFYAALINSFKEVNITHFYRYLIRDGEQLLGVIWVGYTNSTPPAVIQDDFIKTLCTQIHSIIKNSSLLQKSQDEIKRRKIAEEQALQLEKAMSIESMKNEFFTNISHELKTPINILLSTNDLLNYFYTSKMITASEDVNFSRYIGIMKQNSYRLLRLINNLIDITKIDAGEYPLTLAVHNIVQIIEETTLSIKEYIESKNIYLLFDTDIEECFITCDAERIERIMLNLLSNAVKYSHPGGMIYVNITHTPNLLRIAVQDTGIGIPKDKLDFIFQRFGQVNTSLTRPAEGSGIGLSLVHALVKMHGGHIWAESTLGLGSTFTIEFPISEVSDFSYTVPKSVEAKCSLSKNSIERCQIEFSDIYD